MDLILERVQNKFACIIGELCSEPIVLSKFAIWLDLRLAEYKAKGAISLDCLGENPDPIWLKGHEKPLSDSTNITRPYSASPNQSSSHGGFSYGDQFGQSGENTRPVVFESHDRLSPQIVEVKKESLGNAKEVYPVSLHVGGASEKRRDLKRTAFQSDSENFTDSSPSKKWQSSSLQTVTLEETNQSLMSIIGESQDSDEDTVSNSNFQTSFTIPDDQASTSSTSAQPRRDNSSSWSNLQASHSIEEMSMAPQPRQETDPPSPKHNTVGNEKFWDLSSTGGTYVLGHSVYRKRVKPRVMNAESKTCNTIGHLSGTVALLERWLHMQYNELRYIETIPPQELNKYLAHFFRDGVSPTGREFDREALSRFKSYLNRFLKEHNYAALVGQSKLLQEAWDSFRSRQKVLGSRGWNRPPENIAPFTQSEPLENYSRNPGSAP